MGIITGINEQDLSRSKPDFEEVYDRYYFSVLRFFMSRITNRQDAEDLTGEVFLYCYSHYESYDPEKSSISTWIFLVANSRLKNHYRDRREAVDLEDVEGFLFAENEELGRAVFLEQLRDQLADALSTLPEKQRKAVVLRYFQEWDNARIAEELGTTEGNIRVMISRALDRLEERCGNLKAFT